MLKPKIQWVAVILCIIFTPIFLVACRNDDDNSRDTSAAFNGFEIVSENIYKAKVSNDTEYLDFSEIITVNNKSKWTLSTDIQANETIPSKIATLVVGENIYYVLVTAQNDDVKLYTLQIQRDTIEEDFIETTTTIIFDVESHNDDGVVTNKQMDDAIIRLTNIFSSKEGYTGALIVKQGTKIIVTVEGNKELDPFIDVFSYPAVLDFRDEQGNICVKAQDIRGVKVYQAPDTLEYGVLLTFTSEGGSKFRKMIQAATEYTYIHMNNSTEPWSTIRVADRNAGANNTTVITLGTRADGSRPTRVDAERFKTEIEMGLFEVKLTLTEISVNY